jgi:hypothetical protein
MQFREMIDIYSENAIKVNSEFFNVEGSGYSNDCTLEGQAVTYVS